MKIPSPIAIAVLALFTASCSTVHEGVVVAKGWRRADLQFNLEAAYWLDVREGQPKDSDTLRVFLYKKDWSKFKVGDPYPPGSKPEVSPTPRPGKTRKVKSAAPKSTGVPAKKADAPKTPQTSEAHAAARSRELQARAMEDPEVRAWKQKAHTATTDVEQQNALREYQKALSNKMRQLDKSPDERIDATEAADQKPPPGIP